MKVDYLAGDVTRYERACRRKEEALAQTEHEILICR
jgi:hypothetical protein